LLLIHKLAPSFCNFNKKKEPLSQSVVESPWNCLKNIKHPAIFALILSI
jgi:hypothetical protein